MIRCRLSTLFSVGVLFMPAARAERPYVNDQKVPTSRHDLEVIQRHLTSVLPQARQATVCVDLGEGSGSGVVVSKDGLILTAAHVSGGVGKEFTVIFEDGRKVQARSLGLNSNSDAAMAQIVEKGEYPFVNYDREDASRLGDWVFALGHSGGFDKDRGSVVRLGRIVRTSESTIQSDCNLIGGDSGGPLFDLEGRLIAIHSRVGTRLPENMHVPLREFLKHWDRMKQDEFIGDGPFAKRPVKGSGFLGLLTEPREEGGVRVTRVGRESPAELAGIQVGDVILKMDGLEMKEHDDLKGILAEKATDDRVAFEMLREGKSETLTLRLGER